MSYRSRAVSAALEEWRRYPSGRPELYWQEVLNPRDQPFTGDWCGAFVLRSLQQAGLAKGVQWEIGRGFIAPLNLPPTRNPQPGDIAYLASPFQHEALVLEYEPRTGMATTIDGNQPGIEPRVRFVANGNLQFYSIEPLIQIAKEQALPWGFVLGGAAVVGAGAYLWTRGALQLRRLWR